MVKKDRNEIALTLIWVRKEVSDLRVGLSLALASNDDELGRILIKGIASRRIVLKSLERIRAH